MDPKIIINLILLFFILGKPQKQKRRQRHQKRKKNVQRKGNGIDLISEINLGWYVHKNLDATIGVW